MMKKLQICSQDVTRMDLENSRESWRAEIIFKNSRKLDQTPSSQFLSALEIPLWAPIHLIKEFGVR